MKQLKMLVKMCLRQGKVKPDEVFVGADDLEGLTIELVGVERSAAEIVANPSDQDELKFTVLNGEWALGSKSFRYGDRSHVSIKIDWNDEQFEIGFR